MGAQVLFGFLLAIPFTQEFSELHRWQRALYAGDLLLAALAIAVLTAPVAHHRLLFRHHAKASVLRFANAAALAGLAVAALALSGSVLLIFSFVAPSTALWVLAVVTILLIPGLWFGLPALYDRRNNY